MRLSHVKNLSLSKAVKNMCWRSFSKQGINISKPRHIIRAEIGAAPIIIAALF